jgi:hypothetical protein
MGLFRVFAGVLTIGHAGEVEFYDFDSRLTAALRRLRIHSARLIPAARAAVSYESSSDGSTLN